MSPKENLIELLRELFQLNNSDLDFGIYRILKLRSRDVEEFIDYVLPKKLEEVKKKLEDRAADDIKKELENVTTDLKANYGDDFETKTDALGQIALFKEKYGQYKLLRQNLENSRLSEDIENDIYNDLYRFFERYYEEGDFVTKPRAGDKTYMIPYDGEEVKLYWANYDQYYIKTGENFKNYVFTNGKENDDKIIVEFRLKDVETTVNNNQNEKGRLFIPTEEYFEWNEEEKKLNIYFYYKKPTDKEKDDWGNKQSVKKDNKGINEQLILRLEKKIKGTKNKDLIEFYYEEREDKKLFAYHLNRYTALNKFDYFIHKDLKKFLTRELDYYLKNEILSISFLNPEWKDEDVEQGIKLNVVKASAIRELSYTIIEFLDELENFQRRLFEKKKFVVQNEYILTLDMVPEEVLDDVIKDILEDKEEKQLQEWVDLGFLESKKITKIKMKAMKGLVLDTRYLNDKVKYNLLNKVECNIKGLLICSENEQALKLLERQYNEKIKFIYIDPPYNTGDDGFVYKDQFRRATWITFISNRLEIAKKLLQENGAIFVSIDNREVNSLFFALKNIFGEENFLGNIVRTTGTTTGQDAKNFGKSFDFILPFAKSAKYNLSKLDLSEDDKLRFNNEDDVGSYALLQLRKTGNADLREDRPGMYYAVFDPEGNDVYPIGPGGYESRWRFGPNTYKEYLKDDLIEWKKIKKDGVEKWTPYVKYYLEGRGKQPSPLFDDLAGNKKAAIELRNLFDKKVFNNPKPTELIKRLSEISVEEDEENVYLLDFFAGSGTTGDAVHRYRLKNVKYILIEMGEYFDTILLQRIKKILYSLEWKKGKPNNTNISDDLINYIKLEQYEDTLNNIVFDENDLELEFEDKIKYRFRDGAENSVSIMMVDKFEDPFNYQMEILQQNERKLQPVDLATTFNFLLGIDVDRIKTEEHQNRTYRIITGQRKEQGYFIVWRKYDDSLKLDEERDWIKKLDYYDENYKKYCNADNSFGAESTENEFKRLMFEDVN